MTGHAVVLGCGHAHVEVTLAPESPFLELSTRREQQTAVALHLVGALVEQMLTAPGTHAQSGKVLSMNP